MDLMLRFGTTPERRTILEGFLRYRAALHAGGMVDGYQWLNGSFMERVEIREQRPPGDLDVVTVFATPESNLDPSIEKLMPQDEQEHGAIKQQYCVDGYFISLNDPPHTIVQQTTYWYSMWSHQRTDLAWKGYVQVPLYTPDETDACALLGRMSNTNQQP
jgi:hypothetical protein